jgi:hypothetical protein
MSFIVDAILFFVITALVFLIISYVVVTADDDVTTNDHKDEHTFHSE